MRLLIRLRRHPCAKWLQLLISLRCEPIDRRLVAPAADSVDERAVKLPQSINQRLARVAADRLRLRARRIELAHHIVEGRIDRSIASRAQHGQARDDALEMCGQAGSRTCKVRAA